MKMYAIGVDIGGTTVKLGLFSTTGDLLDTWEIVTNTENHGMHILEDVHDTIIEKLQEKNISLLDVEGIGIGVPGPVGPDGTVFKCANLGWDILNVEERLKTMTGLKVKAGNDANVAALGEMWQGGGKGHRNIVMVTLGTGVGGGVIIDGHILAGTNGAAGEIGHIHVVDGETEKCGCGNKGCLEQYVSATGIVRLCKKHLKEDETAKSSLRRLDEITCKDIFDAAKADDHFANRELEQFGKTLGKALAQISATVNPEAFVIGGGVSKAGEVILGSVQKYYREVCFHACRETEFKLAELGNMAGIYGCVRMLIEE